MFFFFFFFQTDVFFYFFFFFSSRRRHTRCGRDWSSDVCSSDLLFFALMDGAGLWKTGSETTSWEKSKKRARLVADCGCADRRKCKHESIILFRSLDRPNWMRGVELSWFFIDEGRHVTRNAWNILWGRLRQKGYEHAGWVCSTPNGYDWMYDLFHPESDGQLPGAEWFGASTMANKDNLDDDYIKSLFAQIGRAHV